MKTIEQDIKTKEFKNMYLLYGEEVYLRNQYKSKLQSALIPQDDTVNLNIYSGKGISIQEVIDQAETMPFFSDRRLIIIEGSGFFKEASPELAEYLEKVPESTFFIFVEDEIDKRGKVYKQVNKNGRVVEFKKQTEELLRRWVYGYVKKENKNITNAAAELFFQKTGLDMSNIRMELEKLLSYTMNKDVITEEDVETICTAQTVDKIFEMIKAMAEKKQKRALDLYYDLLLLKIAPMRILYLITKQLNQIMTVKELRSEGLGGEEIAKKLGIQSFIVRNCIRQAGAFTLDQLKEAVKTAVETEEAVKTGLLSDKLAVELIIIEMSRE